MTIKVEINTDKLAEQVAEQVIEEVKDSIAKEIALIMRSKYRVDLQIREAVKDLYKNHKQEIIDKTIERAAKEITRKALPQLIEKLGE